MIRFDVFQGCAFINHPVETFQDMASGPGSDVDTDNSSRSEIIILQSQTLNSLDDDGRGSSTLAGARRISILSIGRGEETTLPRCIQRRHRILQTSTNARE